MVFSAALSSTLVMNDTSLLILVPLIATMSKYLGEETGARLLSLATIAANIGSSLTPIGNPQNIIIWQRYRLGFTAFTASMAPFTLLGLLLLAAYTMLLLRPGKGREGGSPGGAPPPVRLHRPLLLVSLLLLVLDVSLAELGLPVYAAIATAAAYALVERSVLWSIDYTLIAVFALMFTDFREASSLASKTLSLGALHGARQVLLVAVALSQAVSNVPATIMLVDHVPHYYWRALAVGVNLGGVGLVTGSMANIITLRMGGLKTQTLHKYTLPYFTLLLAATLLLQPLITG